MDHIFGLTPGDIVYDIETYPNVFTWRGRQATTGMRWSFEISFRRNDLYLFCRFIELCQQVGDIRWVGFNIINFDYPVVHFIKDNEFTHGGVTVSAIYDKAMSIIKSFDPFGHMIWESEHLVPQVDLFKIHHFDNKAKSTSLKVLEFNMQMNMVEDLPFPVGTILNDEQADILCSYNDHDVDATELLRQKTLEAIQLREELSRQFGMNLMNCNDVKIGEKILLHEMEKAGVQCYNYVDGRKYKKQTVRESINLAECVFPYVKFEHPEFERIREYFVSRTITETNGIFKDLVATIDGNKYKFGTGGLHMSVESQIVKSDERMQIVDVDVAGYYPALAIVNRVYPAHHGETYCDVLDNLGKMRKQFSKKDPRNGAYKLAGNGVYGLSNNMYSPFFDSQYTMTITINGQLLLCMLVEQLIKVPGLKVIQANTDGITYLCPRHYLDHARSVHKWWEAGTKLTLEEALYKRMFIRDVNSYIAEKEDGTLKRIGAFAYETVAENPATRELPWHKDWSARVVQMAAEAHLVRGESISGFLAKHAEKNIYDFLLRTKVPRSAQLWHGDKQCSNIVRYYISNSGAALKKVMRPSGPVGAFKRKNKIEDKFYNQVKAEVGDAWDERIHTKNKSVYEIRSIGIHTGFNVNMVDRMDQTNWESVRDFDLNWDWYIGEAKKLAALDFVVEEDSDETEV